MKIPQLEHLEFPKAMNLIYPNSHKELSMYDNYFKSLTAKAGYSQKEIESMGITLRAIKTYHSEALAAYIHLDPDCIYDPQEDDPIICRLHTQQIIEFAQKNLQMWKNALSDPNLQKHAFYSEMMQFYNTLEKGINFETGEVLKVIPEKNKLKQLWKKFKSSSNESKPSPSETLSKLKTKQEKIEQTINHIPIEQAEIKEAIEQSEVKLTVLKNIGAKMASLKKQIDRAQSKEELALLEKELETLQTYIAPLTNGNSSLLSAEKHLDRAISQQEIMQMADEGKLSTLNASLGLQKDSLIDVLTDQTTIVSVRALLRQEREQLKSEIDKQTQSEKQASN